MRPRLLCLLLVAFHAFAAPAWAAGEWRWPVRGPVVERYRVGPERFVAGQHRGIDVAAAEGSPVRSACAGRVTFAGWVGAGGRTVSVRCGALTATYQHLARVDAPRGQLVAAGARLGRVGRSGRPRLRVPHLHFGIHRTADRHAYVDPLSLLGRGRGRVDPPLLPPVRGAGPRLGRSPQPPIPAPVRARVATPAARAAAPLPATPATAAGVPTLVWVGGALVLLGVPGDLVRRRRRRRVPSASPRWEASARAVRSS